MAVYSIDAKQLKDMFLAGAANLEAQKEWINELNVFPVPDGDTGTNMTMTIMSAAKEVQNLPDINMATLAKAISSGSLRGARGNSGVILSQLFRGFCKYISDKETLNAVDIAAGFARATETAYKAVMKPKEGTILTVARGMTDKAREIAFEDSDLGAFFDEIIACGNETLARTPDLLPVLKQAGVVDSGGQGLMQVLIGCVDCFYGRTPAAGTEAAADTNAEASEAASETKKPAGHGAAFDEGEIVFGYCTEFIIKASREFTEADEADFKAYLTGIGDCIVVVADDDIVKVHVHTNDPGLALQKALTYGALTKIKIDNMREEHEEQLFRKEEIPYSSERAAQTTEQIKSHEETASSHEVSEHFHFGEAADFGDEIPDQPNKPYGFIVVSIGDGLNDIFHGLNVDYIIEGGQTMNPSTEDMLNAIDHVHADVIFIFPNNGNVILAAEQARTLTDDKEIIVVPSKTVPQGIAALISFQEDLTPQENLEAMIEHMETVKTGEVTYAVRNTCVDDKEIHEGDIMGIGDHHILAVGQGVADVAFETVANLIDENSELVTIYYGADTTEEEAGALQQTIVDCYPDIDVELYKGGQPIYYYVLSVE